MATSLDCIELVAEETPIYEGAPGAGSTPGTGSAPYRVSSESKFPAIQTCDITLPPNWDDRADELRGVPEPVESVLDGILPAFNITQRAYLNDLVWYLFGAGFTDTITVGNGTTVKDPDNNVLPVGTYKHVFVRKPISAITAQSLRIQVARVGETFFEKLNGAAVNSIAMSSAGGLTVAGLGLNYQSSGSPTPLADPNLSPTFDASAILQPRRRDWTIPTWYSNKGTVSDFNWTLTTPLEQDRDPGVTSQYPTKLFYTDLGHVTGQLTFADFATADMSQFLGAGVFAGKFRWVTQSVIGATSTNYAMWMEMPRIQYKQTNLDALANRRRKGATCDFEAHYDGSSGYGVRFTIVCSVVSIGSYI